jgi:hypothetical protein
MDTSSTQGSLYLQSIEHVSFVVATFFIPEIAI